MNEHTQSLPEHPPKPGDLVQVRSRRWLVEAVEPPASPGGSAVVHLACADDDAQGQELRVYWKYELDRRILKDEGWDELGRRGFDKPRHFAASNLAAGWRTSMSSHGIRVGTTVVPTTAMPSSGTSSPWQRRTCPRPIASDCPR